MSKQVLARPNIFTTISRFYVPIVIALLFGAIGIWYLASSNATMTPQFSGAAERDQLTRINNARSARSLHTVKHIECLNALAEKWSKKMATENRLYHNSHVGDGAASTWSITYYCGSGRYYYGETVNWNYSSAESFRSFMDSAAHKAIILDNKWNRVGIGSYFDASGRLWTTYVFTSCGSSCGTTKWSTAAVYPN